MFQTMRRIARAPRRYQAAGALIVLVTAAGALAALLGAPNVALAILVCLVGAAVLLLAALSAAILRRVRSQHNTAMRYQVKADERLRLIYARLDWVTRSIDTKMGALSDEIAADTRRILASVETERYAAAARHHQISAVIEAEDARH